MSRKQNANEVILDELVALAEKAARTITQLQNEIRARDQKIASLEESRAELEKDAYWCRWFRRQYGNSPIYHAVETAFQAAHADFAKSIGAAGGQKTDNTSLGRSEK